MKGIAHFASGLAAASFCPWAVQAGLDGNPLYFVLAGACALLPDTIDFKFYRFFYRHDRYIEPDPAKFDPQAIADELAGAVNEAIRTGKAIRVKLSTIRLGADAWQQYFVKFDSDRREVLVRKGPAVNTGQVPLPGTIPETVVVGRAPINCSVSQTYDSVTRVDIFDGPTFMFEAQGTERVVLHFLPWHRLWTHSFLIGAAVAALGWLFSGWRMAVVMAAGFSVHVIEDQAGFMGSNMFFPITRRRFAGMHWMRSGDALPNFAAVWLSCLLIFWNLYRAAPNCPWHFSLLDLLFYGGALPSAVVLGLHYLLRRGKPAEQPTEVDMSDEWGDTMVT